MGPGEIQDFCPVDETGRSLLKAAMSQLHLSVRAYHRILKLARTIADLAGRRGLSRRIWRRRSSTGQDGRFKKDFLMLDDFFWAEVVSLRGSKP
jgi:hypothetical protein